MYIYVYIHYFICIYMCRDRVDVPPFYFVDVPGNTHTLSYLALFYFDQASVMPKPLMRTVKFRGHHFCSGIC